MGLEFKHQLSEGKLYSCKILARVGEEDILEEELLVIANNSEEARDKAEVWFKEENPGAGKPIRVTSTIEYAIT